MKEIREYFSRNLRTASSTGSGRARPSFSTWTGFNLAEPGWGYQERLDFRHFPMTTPGEYTISAVGRFFHSGPPIPTRPFRVWVDESPG